MDFEQIRWPDDCTDPVQILSRSLGVYVCQHCNASWIDADRDLAVRNGVWREESSGLELRQHLEQHRPISVGFHIPAWISPFVSLSEIASKALEYRLTPTLELLKDLQNNYKAEPWEAEFERRDEDMILALCDDRPRGTIPGPVPLRMSAEASSADATQDLSRATARPAGPMVACQERVAAVLAAVDTQLRYFRMASFGGYGFMRRIAKLICGF